MTTENKGKCLNFKVLTNSDGYVIAKWCNKCFEYLDINSFDWDETRIGYLLGWCNKCNSMK
jgi:hypothetical protein